MKTRLEVLALIEQGIKECESNGDGKVVIFVKDYKIKNWQVVKDKEVKNLTRENSLLE